MIIENRTLDKLEKIRVDFGFKQDASMYKFVLRTLDFIQNRKRDIEGFPNRKETKEQLANYVYHAKILLTTIESIMPVIKEKYNDIYSKMSRKSTIHRHLIIEDFNEALKAFQDMGAYIYPSHTRASNPILVAQRSIRGIIDEHANNVRNCFEKGKVDIHIKINTTLLVREISLQESVLMDYLQNALSLIIEACEIIIPNIKQDGRSSHPLTTSVIIWLAHLYENEGNKKRKARSSCRTKQRAHSYAFDWGYSGEFFEFILRCRGLLKIIGIHLPKKTSSIGDLAYRTLREYRKMTGQKAIQPINKKMLTVAHLNHLMEIPEEFNLNLFR